MIYPMKQKNLPFPPNMEKLFLFDCMHCSEQFLFIKLIKGLKHIVIRVQS